jgi:PAS domain S-box-containing protein
MENLTPQSLTENSFSTIFEQSPLSIQIISLDGRIIKVNRAWEKLWGATLDQIKGYNILEDQQLVEKGIMPLIERAFRGEVVQTPPVLYDPEATIPGVTSNAEPQRWTKAIAYPVRDAAGKIVEVVLMHEDITEQKRAEEKLKESEARHRALFETTLDGIMIVDENGRYLDVNESLCRILKTPREKLIGSHFSEYMVAERLDEAKTAFAELQAKGIYKGDFPMRAADGSVVELEWSSRANILPGLHVCVARDVTERRVSRERYRSLMENANDIIYSHDLAGHYLSINRAGEKITGYTREEMLNGLNISDVVAPEFLDRVRQMIKHKIKDPSPTVYELDIITKDKRRLTLEVSTRISFADGKPAAIEGVARDITERKRAEKERAVLVERLEKQRKHIQEMVASVPGVVWEAWGEPDERHQRIDFVSDYVETMLGYTVEEWLSTPNFWLKIVHPDDKEKAARVAAEMFLKGTAGTNRFRWLRKDKRAIWVEAQSVVIHDENNRPIGMRGVTMDITERKQKEAAERFLAEASTALASSLDYETTLKTVAELAVPHFADWCAVDIADENGVLNRLAVAHVDPSKVEWAKKLYETYPPAKEEPQGLYNVFRTGQSEFYPAVSDELLAQTARDERHLEMLRQVGFKSVMLVPLKIRGNTLGVLIFVNSESLRSHTYDDLALAENLADRAALAMDNARLFKAEQQLRAEAETANRIKDEFLATVSHELRTPLNSIVGWASILKSNQFDAETLTRAVETIERNAKAQTQIIEDLLDVSRIVSGKMNLNVGAIELGSIIKTTLESFRPAADSKNIAIETEFETDAATVLGDVARLQQVMWNLVSNAIKFTPPGGTIAVKLRRAASNAQIVVEDDGQGIGKEFLPYVFDRFRQADSSTTRLHGGLGLGLSIVRHLVEMHGGSVCASSEGVGKGASFTINLPLSRTNGSMPAAAAVEE